MYQLGILIPFCPKWHPTCLLKSSESLVPSSCVYPKGPAISRSSDSLLTRLEQTPFGIFTRRDSVGIHESHRLELSMTQKCCKIDKSTISYIIWCVSPQRTVRILLTSRTAQPMRPIYITWFFTFSISACLKLPSLTFASRCKVRLANGVGRRDGSIQFPFPRS